MVDLTIDATVLYIAATYLREKVLRWQEKFTIRRMAKVVRGRKCQRGRARKAIVFLRRRSRHDANCLRDWATAFTAEVSSCDMVAGIAIEHTILRITSPTSVSCRNVTACSEANGQLLTKKLPARIFGR